PKENILGPLGKGLRVALTVLDFGRTTFGACCTGAAKHCLQMAIEHANSRQQFKKTLGNFDLVKKKIARMAADVYAMEAMTNVTASLIDRGLEDYMIETAMLKVFTTDRLWEAVNDAFQIHGGSAYFDDNPLGRILRDARINQIGEGSNEVLTSFTANRSWICSWFRSGSPGQRWSCSPLPARSAAGIRTCRHAGEMAKNNHSISLRRNIFCANRFVTPRNC